MSRVSRNKKFLNLKGVRVSYNPKDDTIHITSTDQDVAGEPFRVTLKKETEAESILRNLLVSKGLLKEQLSPNELLPSRAMYDFGISRNWQDIPLGLTADGTANWDVARSPHMFLAGATGSGKSVIQRNIFFHCVAHNDNWSFIGIDLKRVELSSFRDYTRTVDTIATTLEEAHAVLQRMVNTLEDRYQKMEEAGINHFSELEDKVKAILIMMDEAFFVLARENIFTEEGKKRDVLHEECKTYIAKIARLGRAAGLHLVLATQRPGPNSIAGETSANLNIRITAGKVDADTSLKLLGNTSATEIPGHIKGRGIIQINGEQELFQGFYAPASLIDDWILEFGKHIEPERYKYLISRVDEE